MPNSASLLSHPARVERDVILSKPWRPQSRRPRVQKPRDKKALVYLRVSTLAQQKDGKNLDGQLDECRAYCKRKGYAFDETRDVFREVVSGARNDRDEYYKLLSRVEKEDAEVIVSWNISRLGRNSLDNAWLMAKAKEHGFRIETAQEGVDFTSDPQSEFLFDILAAAAKYQRNTILQDMTRGKVRGHKDGRWVVGTPPIGYTPHGPRGGKTLKVNEDAWIPRDVFSRYLNGESANSIANDLRARGVAPKNKNASSAWRANMIGRILDNPTYAGYLSYRGDLVRGQHEPLLSQDEWGRVCARRAAARVGKPGRPASSAVS